MAVAKAEIADRLDTAERGRIPIAPPYGTDPVVSMGTLSLIARC